ncbi:hypothetical protein MIND_01304600 [Mycena indigotica]|uniref:Golgi apparatus membrane protein TVP38 n=1 Tax=Mycena indigotica TaxID=2126181 RepID=A0A8H6VUK6_9AGAR|nr:uncharacterized protein MIND_01304600 [Mycena indigotica]KAF7290643.1 hypothetical protein MIND_01304600 [Mycena indigotica]
MRAVDCAVLEIPPPNYNEYPPSHLPQPSTSTLHSASTAAPDLRVETKSLVPSRALYASRTPRTPSPTEEECNLLQGLKRERTLKEKIAIYTVGASLIALTLCVTVFSKKVVNALNPETSWLRAHPAGALIPIVLLVVASFPPLVGHEVIAMIVGITWDLGPAFAITIIGIMLGEIANFLVFKYACMSRIQKYQEKSLDFGLLAYVVRRGGLLMIVVIRYSAMPPHYATSVFATVGVSFWTCLLGAVISLPIRVMFVYTGYAMKPAVSDKQATDIVEDVILGVSILVTIVAYKWSQRQLEAAKEGYVYERRKLRQAKMLHSDRGLFTIDL